MADMTPEQLAEQRRLSRDDGLIVVDPERYRILMEEWEKAERRRVRQARWKTNG